LDRVRLILDTAHLSIADAAQRAIADIGWGAKAGHSESGR
jgi:hypothetical protein